MFGDLDVHGRSSIVIVLLMAAVGGPGLGIWDYAGKPDCSVMLYCGRVR